MLDTNMLMMMGLMDNPVVLEDEKARLRNEDHEKFITEIVRKCMNNPSIRNLADFNKDLAELFIVAEVSTAKGE